MQNDLHPASLRNVECEKLKNIFRNAAEFFSFFGNYLSQAADVCAGLLNSFTLCFSSTDVIIGITTLEETLLLLPITTTHRKTTANVKAREGA